MEFLIIFSTESNILDTYKLLLSNDYEGIKQYSLKFGNLEWLFLESPLKRRMQGTVSSQLLYSNGYTTQKYHRDGNIGLWMYPIRKECNLPFKPAAGTIKAFQLHNTQCNQLYSIHHFQSILPAMICHRTVTQHGQTCHESAKRIVVDH